MLEGGPACYCHHYPWPALAPHTATYHSPQMEQGRRSPGSIEDSSSSGHVPLFLRPETTHAGEGEGESEGRCLHWEEGVLGAVKLLPVLRTSKSLQHQLQWCSLPTVRKGGDGGWYFLCGTGGISALLFLISRSTCIRICICICIKK